MRTSRPLVLLLACLFFPAAPLAQESSPSAASLLQQSLTALTGGASVTDVTMNGTITVTRGSPQGSTPLSATTLTFTSESGTFTFAATASGQSKGTLNMPSGTRSDARNYAESPHVGTATGPSGSSSENPDDLVGPHPAFFYPAFIIASALAQNYSTSNLGQETREGVVVEHVALWPESTSGTQVASSQILWQQAAVPAATVQHAGQIDLYLNPASSLPVAITFSIPAFRQTATGSRLPSMSAIGNLPMYVAQEFDFSNYQDVQGRAVAFTIKVYSGNALSMEIQLSSVNFNAGVTIAVN